MKTFHYICGLPRSGSTLLTNILAQNPAIHTTPTSGCHDVLFGIKNNWNALIEHRASKELSDEANQKRVLRAALNAYHGTDKEIVIDKGRGWTSMMEMVEWLTDEKAKVLVPVRNVPQILASLENLHRKHIATRNHDGDYANGQTTQARVQQLLGNQSVFGLAFDRLRDALLRGYGDRLHFVEFDDLTQTPERKLQEIYDFLELPQFIHNFEKVERAHIEDDTVHNMPDLHTTREAVRPVRDVSISTLGAEIVDTYSGTEFWRDQSTEH